MHHTVLVAGLGNIFLGDDGFGVEVIKRLAASDLPDWVRVADFGIRGMHLLYDIIDQDYDTIILVDTAARGSPPGTVYLIEADVDTDSATEPATPDAHAMTPDMILRFLADFGPVSGRVLVVGCEPAQLEEEIGLSEPVSQAVAEALTLISELVQRESGARVAAHQPPRVSTTMARFDASNSECSVFIFREGILSPIGHDLKLRVGGFMIVSDEQQQSLQAEFRADSFQVVGALKDGAVDDRALSPQDKQQIEENLRKDVLEANLYPDIVFRSTEVTKTSAGYQVNGDLELHGVKKKLQFTIQQQSGRAVAKVSLHQPDFNITPYRALLGALRVKPEVRVEVSVPFVGN